MYYVGETRRRAREEHNAFQGVNTHKYISVLKEVILPTTQCKTPPPMRLLSTQKD